MRLRRNLGVYVHIPFCLSRCGYCDFLTHAAPFPAGLDPANYAQVLGREIARRGVQQRRYYAPAGRVVDSVFFGGGTPTYLRAEALAGLVCNVLDSFSIVQDTAEVTVEANPETLSAELLAALAQAGVNRLSMGVQALQDRHLAFLGRSHRLARLEQALALLSGQQALRWSCDLIYGIPGQNVAELLDSARQLLRLGVEHISAYELTIEPGTPLQRWATRFPRQLASQAQVVEMEQALRRLLAGYGLYRYEVSNYALPGRECQHNLRYWRGGDYFGLGLGAASRFQEQLVSNPRTIAEYTKMLEQAEQDTDAHTALLEQLWHQNGLAGPAPPADTFLRLRTRAGVPAQDCPQAAVWRQRGWIRLHGRCWEISTAGLSFTDAMAREL
jgi:oxygen-independent coproporphyrinogen III oxidase